MIESPFIDMVCQICLLMLLAAVTMSLYRIVIGPTAGDRAVAFDVLAASFMGAITIVTVLWRSSLYFDAVFVLTLIGFLGSVAMARYLEKGRVF